jgi:hypothetical protein
MSNRFGVDLHPDSVRWAANEQVSETVIAAVLLLHERSVEEIVPQLSPPSNSSADRHAFTRAEFSKHVRNVLTTYRRARRETALC